GDRRLTLRHRRADVDRDAVPVLGEGPRDGAPDAAGGTGDEDGAGVAHTDSLPAGRPRGRTITTTSGESASSQVGRARPTSCHPVRWYSRSAPAPLTCTSRQGARPP